MAFTSEYMVEIEEAQKLERELADMTKQRDALAEALEKAKIAEMQLENADINLEQCRLNFVGRIKKLEQERDALAEALQGYLTSTKPGGAMQEMAKLSGRLLFYGRLRECRKIAEPALAATEGGSEE
jgi:hypothetical protein